MISRIIITIIISILVSCAGNKVIINYQKEIPKLIAPADEALCVVLRVNGFSEERSDIYLDTKLVGATYENTLTSFSVKPGVHFLITETDIKDAIRCTFRPGKIYYFKQNSSVFSVSNPYVTVRAHTDNLIPISNTEFDSLYTLKKPIIEYTTIDSVQALKHELSESELFDQAKDFLEWCQENREEAKRIENYSGY